MFLGLSCLGLQWGCRAEAEAAWLTLTLLAPQIPLEQSATSVLGEHLLLLLLLLLPWPCRSQGRFSHFFPHSSLPGSVLPFLKGVFTEAAPALLTGPALACLCQGPGGTGGNHLCLALGSPSFSSQRPLPRTQLFWATSLTMSSFL